MEESLSLANKQLLCAYVGQVHVSVFGRGEWTDDDWRTFCQFGVDRSKEHGWATGSLSFSSGHGPTAAQRRLSQQIVPKEGLVAQKRIVLLSDSGVLRIGMNAFRFVVRGTDLKAFSPNHYQQAIAWLGEKMPVDAAGVRAALFELVQEAGFDPRVLEADWRDMRRANR